MPIKHRAKDVSSTCFWRAVVLIVCCVMLMFIVFADLQQSFNFFVQRYMQPSRKYFLCTENTGSFEKDMFSYAFTIGVAIKEDRYYLVHKKSKIANYFKLSSAKIVKDLRVCETFTKVELPSCCSYSNSLTNIDAGKHFKFENGSGMLSLRYFDDYKYLLMRELSFNNATREKAQNLKKSMGFDTKAVSVVIYVANSTNLKEAYGETFHITVIQFIKFAMDYFDARFTPVQFLVYSNDKYVMKEIANYKNRTIVDLKNFVQMTLSPKEVVLASLTSFDHVITTGAADMFGWWVGYLSGGEVVYPQVRNKPCSGRLCTISSRDLYPHDWTGLSFS